MILLDTHAVFWLNGAPEKLSPGATRAIRRASSTSGLGLSTISLWELAMLVEGGRLRVKNTTTQRFLEAVAQTPGLSLFEINPEIAAIAARWPPSFPGDPADRIIAATAHANDAPLVTKDRNLQESPLVRTIW